MDENILDVEQGVETDSDGNQLDSSDASVSVPLEEYSAENPLPVTVIEEEVEDTGVTYADVGYEYGTISDTYLDYFTGIVEKLPFTEHYVIWKSGDYSYSMAYGKDLEYYPDLISGYDLECVRLYRETGNYNTDWKVKTEQLNNLELRTNDLFVYSDLGHHPTVERGFSALESSAILFAVGFAVVYCVCHDIFDYIMEHVYRK